MVLPSPAGAGPAPAAASATPAAPALPTPRPAPAAGSPSRAAPAPLADPGELPPLDLGQRPWPGQEISSGGVTLHVRLTPGPDDQAPAVYLHGLSGSGTNWTDLAAQLAPHAPGMALDLPGFGRSRPLASGLYSLAAHADAVLCFLAGHGRPVHLLGNSLGGAIALRVAARRPELVRSLTLLAPAMPDRRPDPRRLSDPRILLAAVPGLRARVAARLAEVTPRERVEQMMRLCFGDPSSVPDHRIAEAVAEVAERAEQAWAGEALWGTSMGMLRGWFLGRSLWSVAAGVTAPTLVVWGGRDRLMAPRLAARTASALPRGRLLALPEVGHIPQIERPVTVARAVLGMWRAVEAGRW
ncbi:alpha/beta hydrolase [Pseudonocardia acaciae]|uniref:alpha/beta hydrolase n=1 Tax=Pseudonocardia acaciae TaxID=551276 RepID=UPI000A039772|nr:alpha/beta fold hydrolase [Pseudonocardia acaciae]